MLVIIKVALQVRGEDYNDSYDLDAMMKDNPNLVAIMYMHNKNVSVFLSWVSVFV